MLAGSLSFLFVWLSALALTYALTARFVGITLFFSATTVLYVLLPSYFFPGDAELFGKLVATVILGVLGFFVGFTGVSRLSERGLLATLPAGADIDRIGRTALVLMLSSLTLLLVLRPGFVIELGTYSGRVAFSGAYGPLVFLLNQAVIGAAVLIVWAYHRRQIVLAVLLSLIEIVWAVYSSAKISLLAVSAAWASILIVATWRRSLSRRTTLAILAILLPLSLLIMVFYAVLRSGITDPSLAYAVFAANLERLGSEGVHVGDFGGPYWVFTQHLRDRFLELTLGSTYFEQLLVLIPRVLRSEFLDLTDAFAKRQFGPAYVPGLGFSFSPWAEAYMNFRVPGFFIQGFLFGLLTRFVLVCTARLIGLNEVTILFQLVLITYFERNHLIGQVKATIVYWLPFVGTWLVLETLLSRVPLLDPNRRRGRAEQPAGIDAADREAGERQAGPA